MSRDRRRRAATAIIAIVLAALLVLPFLSPVLGAQAAPAPRETAPAPSAPLPEADGPVVLVGFTGVRWDDVTALATPNLWALADSGSVANLVVRSVRSSTCPVDGWLAVSAGRRAADVPAPSYGRCRALAEPTATGEVPGWSDFVAAAEEASYDAEPGLLGDLLAQHGVTAAALGPGAAVALAGTDGTVATEASDRGARYARRPASPRPLAERLAGLLDRDLVAVDLGSVRDRNRPMVTFPEQGAAEEPTPTPTPEGVAPPPAAYILPEPDRADLVAAVDARLGAVLATIREEAPGATVVVASLADSGARSSLQAVGVLTATDLRDLGDGEGDLLATRSTRQDGIVQSTDLTPTLLGLLGVEAPAGLPGAPLTVLEDPRSGPARVAALQDVGRHAEQIGPLVPAFTTLLIGINLLLYAAVTVGLNRRVVDRTSAWLERLRGSHWPAVGRALRSGSPAAALRTLRTVAVAVAALPVSSMLANLVPWWRSDSTALALYGATALIAALITVAAVSGPWRDHLLAPIAVVAGVTTLVLTADVLTGATLQLSSLLGIRIQVGGRFYGFNNSSFALFAAATILLAMCLAEPLVRRGRRALAGGVVAVVGGVAVVLDGAPTIGADFGGPPALVPAFAVLALLAAGVRLSWRRVLAVLGGAAVLALSFAVLDWLRPPAERSHLGRFVETVLDGGLWGVITRKLEQNLANFFGSSLTFLAIGGTVLVVVVLSRPLRQAARRGGDAYGWLAGGELPPLERDALMLEPGMVALAVALGIGFAVNDSGIVIPAMGISLAVPLLIAVLTGWLLRLQEPAGYRAR